MKINLLKTVLFLSSLSLATSVHASNNDAPPTCPSLDHQIIQSVYLPNAMFAPYSWTWEAGTSPIDSTWTLGVALFLNDEPLRNMTEAQQIQYEAPILQTASLAGAARKIEWSFTDPSQGYFWICTYKVTAQYANWGDMVDAASATYYPDGQIANDDHSLLEKFSRAQQVTKK